MDLKSILTISRVGAGSRDMSRESGKDGSSSFEVSNQHSAQIFMIPRWSSQHSSHMEDPMTPQLQSISPEQRKKRITRSIEMKKRQVRVLKVSDFNQQKLVPQTIDDDAQAADINAK